MMQFRCFNFRYIQPSAKTQTSTSRHFFCNYGKSNTLGACNMPHPTVYNTHIYYCNTYTQHNKEYKANPLSPHSHQWLIYLFWYPACWIPVEKFSASNSTSYFCHHIIGCRKPQALNNYVLSLLKTGKKLPEICWASLISINCHCCI
jgi:hypothetical protein